ncbi:MAG: SH3 domain-containing protein [Clostridia bacterium]|nr:SH3 domain-containing protein [Clostridia bacterium]MBQ7117587.1 SH3 domain-containing protein [Clostridia bacterium]
MVCQKCNHILKGSESFCPDCGSPCVKEKEVYKEPESPSVIFSSDRDVSSNIFVEEAPPKYRQVQPEKKKSRAGLYLVAVLCAVLVGVFAVAGAEIPAVSTAIASLFSSSAPEETTSPTTAEADYSPDSAVVSPQVNYRTSVAYITGDKGQALRKGPDGSYGQIDIIPVGTDVHIVGGASVDGNWVYVYVPEKDTYGWIDDVFLSSVITDVSMQEEEAETTRSKE